ncbi:DUF2958 domain-containing protein [Aliarcobacter sp. ERUVET-8]|uniref:DUF2958 domain-containing protein n=1 Tax=Aliarcobacter sp. ERUVET-8 TaxID=3429684 RepID=UPI003D6AD0E8
MSKLLTDEQLQTIPNLYETENEEDKICHIKLFLPSSNWTWYIIEINKEDNNTCYGLVDGLEQELGYFNIRELENLKGMFGLKVELDTSFKPTKLSKIKGE